MPKTGCLSCVLKLSAVITPTVMSNSPKRGPGSSAAVLAIYPARSRSGADTFSNPEA